MRNQEMSRSAHIGIPLTGEVAKIWQQARDRLIMERIIVDQAAIGHLTLAWLGTVNQPEIQRAAGDLEKCAEWLKKTLVLLTRVQVFSGAEGVVAWMAIPTDAMVRVAGWYGQKFPNKERLAFLPHITLGRLAGGREQTCNNLPAWLVDEMGRGWGMPIEQLILWAKHGGKTHEFKSVEVSKTKVN